MKIIDYTHIEAQFEREEEDIEARHARGEISRDQYWQELKELQRVYRAAIEEVEDSIFDEKTYSNDQPQRKER